MKLVLVLGYWECLESDATLPSHSSRNGVVWFTTHIG